MSEWISVHDGLPKEEGDYLCFVNDIVNNWCVVLKYGQEDYDSAYMVWMIDGAEFPAIVTHWKEIAPPEDA